MDRKYKVQQTHHKWIGSTRGRTPNNQWIHPTQVNHYTNKQYRQILDNQIQISRHSDMPRSASIVEKRDGVTTCTCLSPVVAHTWIELTTPAKQHRIEIQQQPITEDTTSDNAKSTTEKKPHMLLSRRWNYGKNCTTSLVNLLSCYRHKTSFLEGQFLWSSTTFEHTMMQPVSINYL